VDNTSIIFADNVACSVAWKNGTGERELNLSELRELVPGAQAPGAQVEPLGAAVNGDRGRVNIGRPAPVGMALGVADIMTEKRGFPAYVALHLSRLLGLCT
jgi:hypothetical protein